MKNKIYKFSIVIMVFLHSLNLFIFMKLVKNNYQLIKFNSIYSKEYNTLVYIILFVLLWILTLTLIKKYKSIKK